MWPLQYHQTVSLTTYRIAKQKNIQAAIILAAFSDLLVQKKSMNPTYNVTGLLPYSRPRIVTNEPLTTNQGTYHDTQSERLPFEQIP